jgi:hypothetical protein
MQRWMGACGQSYRGVRGAIKRTFPDEFWLLPQLRCESRQAAAVAWAESFTLTIFEIPGSSMVTP